MKTFAPLHGGQELNRKRGTHLRTSKMPEIVEPVHVGPTVVEGVNELVCDDPVHVGLLVNVVLTQDDLQDENRRR